MPQLNEAAILEALKSVRDPDRGADIVSLGMISGLVLKQGNVGFSIEVAPERGQALEPLRKAAERAVAALPGVLSVTAVLTAHSEPAPEPVAQPGRQAPQQPLMPGVAHIVAVASGKGGVASRPPRSTWRSRSPPPAARWAFSMPTSTAPLCR